jgi:hypothetical protein
MAWSNNKTLKPLASRAFPLSTATWSLPTNLKSNPIKHNFTSRILTCKASRARACRVITPAILWDRDQEEGLVTPLELQQYLQANRPPEVGQRRGLWRGSNTWVFTWMNLTGWSREKKPYSSRKAFRVQMMTIQMSSKFRYKLFSSPVGKALFLNHCSPLWKVNKM